MNIHERIKISNRFKKKEKSYAGTYPSAQFKKPHSGVFKLIVTRIGTTVS